MLKNILQNWCEAVQGNILSIERVGEESELRMDRVAVYGTLKRGQENHCVLAGSQFLGIDRLARIVLYDLGAYPAARLGESSGIEVEVYAVESETLKALDRLEEYDPLHEEGSLYRRTVIASAFGNVWIYLYNGTLAGRRPIKQGSWTPRARGSSASEVAASTGASR